MQTCCLKKIIASLVICSLLLSFCLPSCLAQKVSPASQPESAQVEFLPSGLTAQACYLVNLNTNKVVYAKNEEERRAPASTTKIMTILLALESDYPMDTKVTASPTLWAEFAGIPISNADIRGGETLTLKDLIYAAALPSANEAAATLADFLGGGNRQAFLDQMNKRAKELGAENTHFTDPYGLASGNHYTTAKDLYLIAAAALTHPEFLEIVSTKSYTLSPTNFHSSRTIRSTNALMRLDSPYYFEGAKGIKTGSTEEAGRCFVGYCEREENGETVRYLSVVLGCPLLTDWGGWRSDNTALENTKTLYTWAYDQVSLHTLAKQGDSVGTIPVTLSEEASFLPLVAKEDLKALLPNDLSPDSLQQKIQLTQESLEAPVEQGTLVGTLSFSNGNGAIWSVPLLAGGSATRSCWLYFLSEAEKFWNAYWLPICLVAVLLLLFLLLRKRNRRRKKRKASKRRR